MKNQPKRSNLGGGKLLLGVGQLGGAGLQLGGLGLLQVLVRLAGSVPISLDGKQNLVSVNLSIQLMCHYTPYIESHAKYRMRSGQHYCQKNR